MTALLDVFLIVFKKSRKNQKKYHRIPYSDSFSSHSNSESLSVISFDLNFEWQLLHGMAGDVVSMRTQIEKFENIEFYERWMWEKWATFEEIERPYCGKIAL